MITLTDEQVLAATAPERLVNIISVPGSGKTTVAAERFGFQRFRNFDRRGVVGLSFTRAAVNELASRITARWGSKCLVFPHRVMTFDSLHTTLVERLLSAGVIHWPNAHKVLDVRDDYRGFQGFRWLTNSNYRRTATLNESMKVVSAGIKVRTPGVGIGNREHHDALLNVGITSHEDVRSVLFAALKRDVPRRFVADWLSTNFRATVIDEVYDAAPLDLDVAHLAAQSGLCVTIIGDPRQALYGWRGARPDLVDKLLTGTSEPFVKYQQTTSFRFSGPQMPALARSLRNGNPTSLPPIESSEVDVVLARQWRHLWSAGDNVLPLAFRTITSATDAALNLLLDVVTRAHFGRNSFGRETAMTQLRLDRASLAAAQDSTMQPVLEDLVSGVAPEDVLHAVRDAALALGANRRPSRLQAATEAGRVDELRWLARRLQHGDLIPGLTVHQAKGGEWPRVGVVLTRQERQLLAAGLRELEDEDCVVYVALTRAKTRCGLLAGDLTLDMDGVDMSST